MRNMTSTSSTVKKVTLLVGIFLITMLLTGGTVAASYSQPPPIPLIPTSTSVQTDAQDSPKLFLMSSETTAIAHELPLRAVKSGEQVTIAQDFKVGLSNVLWIPLNGKLNAFSTESIQITNVKLTNTQNQVSELSPVQNVISFAGFPQGVYTLNVIVSKDNRELAYEGILVIGQTAQTAAVNQVIAKEKTTEVREVFDKPQQKLGNDPCNYYGLNVCDKDGNCDPDRFDCYSDDCVNGQPGTTGQCDGDDDKVCWVNGEYTGKCDPKQQQPVAVPFPKPCDPLLEQLTPDGSGCEPSPEAFLPPQPLGVAANLPPCDGSYQDCLTPRGDVCEAGSGAHECEIEEPEEVQELSCQEEDDFCEPGCESPTMDCIDDVNLGDDGEDSTTEEDNDELPNCNNVEAGTRCDGSEDEDSWTDEEVEEEAGDEEEEESGEEEEEEESFEEEAEDEDAGGDETFG